VTVKITDTDDGGSSFLRNVAAYLADCTASRHWILTFSFYNRVMHLFIYLFIYYIYWLRAGRFRGLNPGRGNILISSLVHSGPGAHQICCTIGVWTGRGFGLPITTQFKNKYRGADKSLARPGRKQGNISVSMAWISFGALLCRKKNLMTARVSILLKLRASLTCFRASFLPGWAKDLSAPR